MTSMIDLMNEEEVARGGRPEEGGFGALECARGRLPLRAMNVRARITGLIAEIELDQTFENTFREPIEATYIFPLPDRAGVTRFRMEVNGRVTEGVIKERGQARLEYSEAIRAGHRAAITEEERSGVFTIRAGNLMPGERAKISLGLTGPVPFDEGEATFRFPLVVAPRYIPGTTLGDENVGEGTALDTDAVPDASRITPPVLLPGFPNPVHLTLSVELDASGLPVSSLRSSLHSALIRVERGVYHLEVRPGERLNRDFVLRYRIPGGEVKTSLVFSEDPGSEGGQGTFALTLVPPQAAPGSEKPRDVVFVLDRSGSMEGWKMVAARRAVARMVDTLRERDSFTVLAFDDQIEAPPSLGPTLAPATDRNRFRAVEFLATVGARGGTELARPLELGARLLGGGYADRERILVLATDGQVGNEDQLLRVLRAGAKDLRIFAIGIDRAVNEGFLRRLAALGGGMAELVESEDRLDEVMDKIHRRIGTPVLTEVSLGGSGVETEPGSIVPSRVPDLFSGAPVVISGRWRGRGRELTVTGREASGRGHSMLVRATSAQSEAVRTLWARGLVRELEDRLVVGRGDPGELERRITSTSLAFGVLSRFTAFLAVDRRGIVNPGGEQRVVVQPVDAPEGWQMFEGGAGASLFAASPSGAVAPQTLVARVLASASELFTVESEERPSAPRKRREGPAPAGPASAPPPPAPPVELELGRASPPYVGAPAPKQASAKPRGGHLVGSPRSQEQRKEDAAMEAPSSGVELAPYRRRAAELLERLRDAWAASNTSGRIAELGRFAGKLRALIEDLSSVGATPEVVRPLRELEDQLRRLLQAAAPREAEVTAAWTSAERILEELASGSPGSRGSRKRRDFWKG